MAAVEVRDEPMTPSRDVRDHGGATEGDVQPDTEVTCSALIGLSLYTFFICCSLALVVRSQVMLAIAMVFLYMLLAGALMHLLCRIIRWLVWQITRQLQWCISAFSSFSVALWSSCMHCLLADWEPVWSCSTLSLHSGADLLQHKICHYFLSSDSSVQRTKPTSYCEPPGPKSRADPPSGPYPLRSFLSSRWLSFLILFIAFSRGRRSEGCL